MFVVFPSFNHQTAGQHVSTPEFKIRRQTYDECCVISSWAPAHKQGLSPTTVIQVRLTYLLTYLNPLLLAGAGYVETEQLHTKTIYKLKKHLPEKISQQYKQSNARLPNN